MTQTASRQHRFAPAPRRDWIGETPRVPASSRVVALCAAALSGLLLALSFPPYGMWPLALVAPGLFAYSIRGRGFWAGAGLGFVSGFAFYTPLVSWTSLFLGPVPWMALAVAMGGTFALGGAFMALATPSAEEDDRPWWSQFVLGPLVLAGIWTLRESLFSMWPWGGFAWGRLAQSQAGSPLAEIVAWTGLSAMGTLIAWWSIAGMEVLLAAHRTPRARPDRVHLPALGAAFAVLMLAPSWQLPEHGTVRVAAVQGDTPESAYFIPSEPGYILQRYLDVTRETVPENGRVEAILWPEGSLDSSPEYVRSTDRKLRGLSSEYGGAPIVANTVTISDENGEERYFNTQFTLTEDGWQQDIQKVHPVPFGEYIPERDFFYLLAPDLVGLVERSYSPGDGWVVLDIAGHPAGTLICFDVIDDAAARGAVAQGAEFLYLPSNNADFGQTHEADQQLAFGTLRAIETGRTVVQVSTVGHTVVIGPDGRVKQSLNQFESGAIVADIPLVSGTTPALVLGRALELLASGIGAVGLFSRLDARRLARRSRA